VKDLPEKGGGDRDISSLSLTIGAMGAYTSYDIVGHMNRDRYGERLLHCPRHQSVSEELGNVHV
jgi:hypothetical protein